LNLEYRIVDVFTDRPFGGNPLAVFPEADGIPSELMQRIARELNLSETTFVLPPGDPENDFRVRIFTPAREIPMAGHPTVGTAFVLSLDGQIPGDRGLIDEVGHTHVTFEEGVGPIAVEITPTPTGPGVIWMDQPLPELAAPRDDRAEVAETLGLDEADLDPELPLQVASAGVPYLYVPLRDLDALDRATLRLDLWRKRLEGTNAQDLFLLARETDDPDLTVRARMFAPAFGIPEDPATGSATGPLGAYLLEHGAAHGPDDGGVIRMRSGQGFEMGRPSLLEIELHLEHESEHERLARVRVGGNSVSMGSGRFELQD